MNHFQTKEGSNIATHSPFMLGTLNAKIYNIDTEDYRICEWYELENSIITGIKIA